MNPIILICAVGWIILSIFFSLFIVYFDRRKIWDVRHGFFYVGLFFMAGIALLYLAVLH